MPAKKERKREYKKPECTVLLHLRTQEMPGREAKKGLNKTELWVVRWFKRVPKLELRQMFFREDLGEWVYKKNLGLSADEWDFIRSDPVRDKAVNDALHSQ